jgi:hypothetical protein
VAISAAQSAYYSGDFIRARFGLQAVFDENLAFGDVRYAV